MRVNASRQEIDGVCTHVRDRGFEPIELPGADRLAIGVLGTNPGSIRDAVVDLPGVDDAIPVSKPYKQVTREWHPESASTPSPVGSDRPERPSTH